MNKEYRIIYQLIERCEKSNRIKAFSTREVKGTYDWNKAYLIRHKTAARKDVHTAVIVRKDADMSALIKALI